MCQQGPSWPWSYGSWILNYLCNQCLSPLMLWVWISIWARCTTLCDKSLSVTCDRSVVFCGSSGFLYQLNWPPRFNWNIVESGIKHHQTNKQTNKQEFPCLWCLFILQVQQMRNAALEIREEAESTSRFTQITAAANYTSVVMYYLFIFDLQYFLEN